MVDFVKLDKDKDKKKRRGLNFNLRNIFIILVAFFLLSSVLSGIQYSMQDKIAVIPVKGPILVEGDSGSLYGSEGTSSRYVATIIRSVAEDTSVKAIVIDINSPGGSPVASEEISNAIHYAKERKPVYALITESGTSGALWVSVAANKTYASSMSIIGSIGVTSAGLSFEDFIKEYNISYRKQTAGELKDIGSIFREQTEEEKAIIQKLLDDIHVKFISHVAENRNLPYTNVEQIATGEFFLGERAMELGLVDEIGGYEDVLDEAMNVTGAQSALIIDYTPEPTLLEALGIENSWNLNTKTQVLLQ